MESKEARVPPRQHGGDLEQFELQRVYEVFQQSSYCRQWLHMIEIWKQDIYGAWVRLGNIC